jgi:hypothetical protein
MDNNIMRRTWIAVFAVLLVASFSGGLLAYIDPGTGSYIFQAAIITITGAFFGIKVFWKNIINFFSRLSGKKSKGK